MTSVARPIRGAAAARSEVSLARQGRGEGISSDLEPDIAFGILNPIDRFPLEINFAVCTATRP